MKKIYIAGPMSGKSDHNYQEFHDAETEIIIDGGTPISPAAMALLFEGWQKYPPPSLKPSYADRVRFMRRDLLALLDLDFLNDAIYMLKGWEDSKGAKVEHALAEYLGLEIIYQ